MSRLFAISDTHFSIRSDLKLLEGIDGFKNDILILAGDIAEDINSFTKVVKILSVNFKRIIWTPGNHELWVYDKNKSEANQSKYNELVSVCAENGVITPEDEYYLYSSEGVTYNLVPTFLLYDYTFKPDDLTKEEYIKLANDHGCFCLDEYLLDFSPFSSTEDWCARRCEDTKNKIRNIQNDFPIVLINHYPLIYELSVSNLNPFFQIWSGTQKTKHWIENFNIEIVVYGHMHVPATHFFSGVVMEEVSYPFFADKYIKNFNDLLRQILPNPERSKSNINFVACH